KTPTRWCRRAMSSATDRQVTTFNATRAGAVSRAKPTGSRISATRPTPRTTSPTTAPTTLTGKGVSIAAARSRARSTPVAYAVAVTRLHEHPDVRRILAGPYDSERAPGSVRD